MAQQDVDVHAGETPAATPTQPTTNDALTFLKNALGAVGGATFTALSAALGVLTKGLVAAIADRRKQVATMASNKLALTTSALQVPTVKPPDLSGATRTITTTLATVNTPDTVKVNQAAAAAATVRNPDRLASFKSTVINQVADETNQDVRTMGELLKSVQGVRNQVESV
jgi:endonuclease YncB( thermonuclease family)